MFALTFGISPQYHSTSHFLFISLSISLFSLPKKIIFLITHVSVYFSNFFCHFFIHFFSPPFLFFFLLFSQIHKPIIFSTSPHSKYTHWKQTVFYITNPLTVCAGEEINAKIKCNPNINNPRDLDISIIHKFEGKSMKSEGEQMYRLR